jgi:lysine biosynthesis protein LysW
MAMAVCPACEAQINIPGQVEMGQNVVCPQCSEDLEVIDTDPLELDWAYEELDWDEDDEDEDTF